VRVELSLATGGSIWAQITCDDLDELELARGDVVWARPRRSRSFVGA
jgi:ABC-type molybdate transport system ATPase subunit